MDIFKGIKEAYDKANDFVQDRITEGAKFMDEKIVQPTTEWVDEAIDYAEEVVEYVEDWWDSMPDPLDVVQLPFDIADATMSALHDGMEAMTTTDSTPEVKVEDTLRELPDNVSPEEAEEKLTEVLNSEAEAAKEVKEDVLAYAEQALQRLEDASAEDVAEVAMDILIGLAQRSTALAPVVAEIVGPRLAQAIWDKLEIKDVAGLVLKYVENRYDTKTEESILGPILSVLMLRLDQQQRSTLLASLSVAATAAQMRKEGAFGIATALAAAFNLEISPVRREMIEGYPYYVYFLGRTTLAISAVPVPGYDVRVLSNKRGEVKGARDALSRIPKGRLRQGVSAVVDAYSNYMGSVAAVERLEKTQANEKLVSALRNYLQSLKDEAVTPDQSESAEIADDEVDMVESETALSLTQLSEDDSAGTQRRERPLLPEVSDTSAFQRAQARRARIVDWDGHNE